METRPSLPFPTMNLLFRNNDWPVSTQKQKKNDNKLKQRSFLFFFFCARTPHHDSCSRVFNHRAYILVCVGISGRRNLHIYLLIPAVKLPKQKHNECIVSLSYICPVLLRAVFAAHRSWKHSLNLAHCFPITIGSS